MLIDFHTHCFPDKLAKRAIPKLSDACGGLIPQTDGTADGLLALMDKTGVDKACIMNIATNPHQMQAVNDFAASINCDRLISFGSVHPDAPNAFEELERIAELGLKGVKFHPDYQGFMVDDEKMKPIYHKVSDLGLIALFHAGFDYGFAPPYNCMPKHSVRALSWFDSPVVLAHWGGINCGLDVLDKLCGLDVYFDTSFGYGGIPKAIEQKIVEKHGTDKLLFGSDAPWHNPDWEKRNLNTLGFNPDELEKVCHVNAEKLLKL